VTNQVWDNFIEKCQAPVEMLAVCDIKEDAECLKSHIYVTEIMCGKNFEYIIICHPSNRLIANELQEYAETKIGDNNE